MQKPIYKNYIQYLYKFYGKGYTDIEVRSKAHNKEGGWHGDVPMGRASFKKFRTKMI
jgi:hypothetical protein